MPRLIDADALKKDWHMGSVCETCSKDTRQCSNDYCFSRMDVCGMIDDAPTVSSWISVKDRLPEEKPSMWSPLYGGAKWREGLMWKVESERVLVAIRFPDGTGVVRTGKTADGKWHTDVSPVLEQTVTHWMPMPTMPEADT